MSERYNPSKYEDIAEERARQKLLGADALVDPRNSFHPVVYIIDADGMKHLIHGPSDSIGPQKSFVSNIWNKDIRNIPESQYGILNNSENYRDRDGNLKTHGIHGSDDAPSDDFTHSERDIIILANRRGEPVKF